MVEVHGSSVRMGRRENGDCRSDEDTLPERLERPKAARGALVENFLVRRQKAATGGS